MAILDAGPFQNWINAYDIWERAHRRYNAACETRNKALIDYVRNDVGQAAQALNDALKALNA